MKNKNRVLLASMATIAMCGSLVVGGTYALFTSESTVDISVTAGTVSVKARVSELTLYSYGTEGAVNAFANGGTAVYDAKTNELKLDNITPGDKVTFNIIVENESSVATKYRTVSQVKSDNGLYSGLTVTMESDGTNGVSGAALNWTSWQAIAPVAAGTTSSLETVAVTIELPYLAEKQNAYQGKSCSLSFAVEAVQGNADVADDALTVSGGFEVERTEEGGVKLTSLPAVSESGVVEVPVGVTEIGETFTCNYEITKVVLPETVTSIDQQAFMYCGSLEEVVIPNSVTTIGAGAFAGCSSLTEVAIPDGVTEIGASAFFGCSSLTEVAIPDGVTTIGGSTFSGCSSLTEVAIPNGVTEIGASAFSGCSSLATVELPTESTLTIGSRAFSETGLQTVVLTENISFAENASYVFADCQSLESVVIEGEIAAVPRFAFQNCSSLATVELPDAVTKIEASAFQYCSALTEIALPEDLKTIGEDAFQKTGLTEVAISENVTSIGNDAFADCPLTEFELAENSTATLGQYVIARTQVETVTIPASVTLTAHTFRQCGMLKHVVFEGLVDTIPNFTFNQCYELQTITFMKNTALPKFSNGGLGGNTSTEWSTSALLGIDELLVIMPNYSGAVNEEGIALNEDGEVFVQRYGYEFEYNGETITHYTYVTIKTSEE